MVDTLTQDFASWIGHEVYDANGKKVGKVSQIFLDEQTETPEWLSVNTGMFKTHSSFVPLQGARAEGDRLVLAFEKDHITDAPRVDDDGDGYISPEEEAELYRYYGREYAPVERQGVAYQEPADVGRPTAAERTQVVDADAVGTVPPGAPTPGTPAPGMRTETDSWGGTGRDVSGPTTDDAMTRSEEQVQVGTATRERGRARLRKYVVTEDVQQTVPVSHEEVRVEREPITDANRDAALSGPEISEEEHEMVLNEERPVVEKEVVPVERVRLEKERVTDQETVDTQVRKERIDTEGAGKDPRRGR